MAQVNDEERAVVLFACVHNAGRSQMAAAFARRLGGDRLVVLSAGSEPAPALNPRVVAAMAEAHVDITAETPRLLEDADVRRADVVVTMGCGDECPFYPGRQYLDWELDDPATLDLAGVRRVRDDIESRVQILVSGLLERTPAG